MCKACFLWVYMCSWAARGLCGSNKFILLGLIPTLLLQLLHFFFFYFLLGEWKWEWKKKRTLPHVMFACAHLPQAAGRCVNTMNYGWSCWSPQSAARVDLFYSSLSSRTPCGTGKTQNLPIFYAWEVSPGLYWLKLGKEKLESFHTFPVWKILLFKRIFQSKKQLSKANLCFSLLEMNSSAVCQGIFLGLKGRDGKRFPIKARERQKQGLSMDCSWHRSWVLVWLGARSVVCLDFCFLCPWKGMIEISLARLFSGFLDKNFAGISYMAQKPL